MNHLVHKNYIFYWVLKLPYYHLWIDSCKNTWRLTSLRYDCTRLDDAKDRLTKWGYAQYIFFRELAFYLVVKKMLSEKKVAGLTWSLYKNVFGYFFFKINKK